VHNRRLFEFRIKRSISKAHRKGREIVSSQKDVNSGRGGAQQNPGSATVDLMDARVVLATKTQHPLALVDVVVK
jgi:hypothetical protein